MTRPITRDDVRRLMADESAQLVEVLPVGEYEDEHLPRAINLPLKEIGDRAPHLDTAKPVTVYCYDYT
jgi:rhodanese-related sulfurtransferase